MVRGCCRVEIRGFQLLLCTFESLKLKRSRILPGPEENLMEGVCKILFISWPRKE